MTDSFAELLLSSSRKLETSSIQYLNLPFQDVHSHEENNSEKRAQDIP